MQNKNKVQGIPLRNEYFTGDHPSFYNYRTFTRLPSPQTNPDYNHFH